MVSHTYGFEVAWSEEDEEFVATCPSFPSVSAFGETQEEAVAEAQVALGLLIQEYHAQGASLPEPMSASSYSGQFRQRLSRSLHAALARRAAKEGVSQNSLVLQYIAEGLAGHGAVDRIAAEVRTAVEPVREDVGDVLRCVHGLEDGHHMVAQGLVGISERLAYYAVPEPPHDVVAGSYEDVRRQVERGPTSTRPSFG